MHHSYLNDIATARFYYTTHGHFQIGDVDYCSGEGADNVYDVPPRALFSEITQAYKG